MVDSFAAILWIHELNKEGPVDGSNTVLVGTASGVVKARTIKRLPPGERWSGSLLDEACGSVLAPNALEDDGGRVVIKASVLQPHAAVPLPPLAPEVRQVRRAIAQNQPEQVGYTDNCPGCGNARASCKQAVDHSGQCRSHMEAILVTTTKVHMRLERARERFAQVANRQEPRVMESSRKRHRLKGEGEQPLAPSASAALESCVRSNHQEGGGAGSGSALPACDTACATAT